MADQIKVATFTTRTGAGTQDFTHPELTETFTAAIFIYGATTSDSTDVAHGRMGFGACCARTPASADNQNACFVTQRDNSSLSAPDENTIRQASAGSACIFVTLGDNDANVEVDAAFDSVITNGVRLNFTTADSAVKVTVIFFAGLDGAHIDTGATFSSLSLQTGVAPFFQPDALFLFGGGQTLNASAGNAQVNIGFAARGGSQVSAFVNSADVTEPTDADGRVSTTAASVEFQGSTRTTRVTTVTSFNADGFSVSADTANSRNFMCLALKFSGTTQFGCIAGPISASTGNQDFTGFGFTPAVVIGMSTLLASADTDTSGATASASGLFVTGEEGERAYTERGENGRSGTAISFNRSSRQEDVGLLTLDHLGSVAQRATWVGGITDGFRLNFSTATSGYLVAMGFSGGNLTSATSDTERISDSHFLNLISRLILNETVTISDGLGGLELADGLTALQDTGSVFQGGAVKGEVFQGGAVSGVVEG